MHADAAGKPEPVPSKGPSWMGCLIPLLGVGVLFGLATCTVLTGWMQNRAIAGFTEAAARPYGRDGEVPGAAEVAALEAKLGELSAAAREGRRSEVAFTAAELNHLLRTRAVLESLRDSTRVVRIGPDALEVESSQPVRKLGGGFRYLNGRYFFRPIASGTNAWQLELLDLRVPGKEVPPGFLGMARELRLFRFDLDAKELQAVLRQVEVMELREGSVRVVTRGSQVPGVFP